MNCKDCLDKIEPFTDRELSASEVADLKVHLDECPPCKDRFRFQADFKRLIRISGDQDRAPDALRAKLRQILS
jgi:mycothiol system anti-sigma-R factor